MTTTTSDPATNINGDQAVVAGTLRAPWKWESLLVESAVIGGSDRWARRLDGLAAEYELKIRELTSEQARLAAHRAPGARAAESCAPPRFRAAAHRRDVRLAKAGDLGRLDSASSKHLRRSVLRRPEFVLRVLADLRPMAAVGPVTLAEVRDVLADRLAALEVEPPAHRYGRVFVCSPDQVRGRAFRVAFVPGLAERLFPQKLREDPLLLDDLRREIGGELTLQDDRAEHERLLLRLAVGVATERLYVSFPRIETARGPRAGPVVLRARSHARRDRPHPRPSDSSSLKLRKKPMRAWRGRRRRGPKTPSTTSSTTCRCCAL